jgi:predicted NUDIX family NTP pyrophosphohydrolase
MGLLQPLGEIRQRSGKRVHSFAVNGDLDVQRPMAGTIENGETSRVRGFPVYDSSVIGAVC